MTRQNWIGDPIVKDIRETKHESESRLEKTREFLPGLVGYGITHGSGERISVLVEEITPKIMSMFRNGIRGHDVELVEVGHVVALNRTGTYRPMKGGISIGHEYVTAGTLGCIVYDKYTGEPVILSNNHVLANTDTPTNNKAEVGDRIYQPGRIDGGTEVAGRLLRWLPLEDYVTIDAAVALPTVDHLDEILDIGEVYGIAEAEVGMIVRKSGRTTELTHGVITDIEVTIKVGYGDETITLVDQFMTQHISDGGDSGSVLIDENNCAIGLLFAGSDFYTIYNRIQNVCEILGIEFMEHPLCDFVVT